MKLAVWTTSKEPRPLVIPATAGTFHVTDHLGKALPDVTADEKGLTVTATDAPQYLTPDKPNDILRLAAALERVALDTYFAGGRQQFLSLEMRNPLADPIRAIGSTTGLFEPHLFPIAHGGANVIPCRAYVYRDAEPKAVPVQIEVREVAVIQQWAHVIATNPLTVMPAGVADGRLALRVENPSGAEFEGIVFVTDQEEGRRAPLRRISLSAGETEKVIQIPFASSDHEAYRLGLRVEDPDHNIAVKVPAARYKPVDHFNARGTSRGENYRVVAEGDAKVESEASLSFAAPEGDGPVPGAGSLVVGYHIGEGHKFLRIEPLTDALKAVEGEPKALGLWVYGDGQGHHARMRFTDAKGQTFQPDAGRVTWKGWRYVTFPLSGQGGGHWGGPDDGVVHYPIRVDTLFLLDKKGKEPAEGSFYLAEPVLVY